MDKRRKKLKPLRQGKSKKKSKRRGREWTWEKGSAPATMDLNYDYSTERAT